MDNDVFVNKAVPQIVLNCISVHMSVWLMNTSLHFVKNWQKDGKKAALMWLSCLNQAWVLARVSTLGEATAQTASDSYLYVCSV